jgi:hypothetical protein
MQDSPLAPECDADRPARPAARDQGQQGRRMLVANVLACHCGAMEMFELAATAGRSHVKASYIGLGAKLARTMAQLIETIDRHRGVKAGE